MGLTGVFGLGALDEPLDLSTSQAKARPLKWPRGSRTKRGNAL